MDRKILLIYTGGTIGMKQNPDTLLLEPFDFTQILQEVPELRKFGFAIDTYSFDPVIDSSDANPAFWVRLCELIGANYKAYDGFVVLHGTDTMAYSASALSFMLENLEKPVIFTGSQLPIGMLRTDGKENLIDSLELAAACDAHGHPYVSEVCIYFENELFRGNRTTKYSAENFSAFRSPNYPPLAEVGTHIRYNNQALYHPSRWGLPLLMHTQLDNRVAVLKIFPGISEAYVRAVLATEGLRAVVLETFGSGNAPSYPWFLQALSDFTAAGGIVVNITQCQTGMVDMGAYANGDTLRQAGVVCGRDMTTEAAVTKLFVLLGQYSDNKTVAIKLEISSFGEIS
ncbi:MAG: asparaginase [Bacteroidales bacterium]|jgi:L-asparaginase|nr:asparaginase [Bacteroidales bacterium]MBQ2148759.1 asparaginase [Bacteroidales bacterium]MBQ2194669.1 asparaginase [Bacteroidales bacterium]MBQ5435679.1 asparaginase [Bacteroidales bacterium]MBQ5517229.1 asparaginase [Bacteroidales bacterium]